MPHETTHRFLASELPVAEPESCLFHVLPVPLEATVSYAGGTARGPEAILEASDQLELWDGESVPAEAGIYTWPAVDISVLRKPCSAGWKRRSGVSSIAMGCPCCLAASIPSPTALSRR